jgi:hypothetical protein
MTDVIMARPKAVPHWVNASAPRGKWSWSRPDADGTSAEADAEPAYLAVIVTSAAEPGKPAFDEWQAELKLVECSRALPLAWPLPEWLDDYRDLLVTALHDQRSTHKRPQRAWWTEEIREFLRIVLAGRDRSAADFIRTLTQLHPFADQTRRLRRVQALFASIRPACSLAEAFGFRIVTK